MAEPAVHREQFAEAIQAFAGRGEIVRKDEFLALEERMRARAFTVARTGDADVIADIYDALTQRIGTGGSWRDFVGDLDGVWERRGWGTEPWHARIIFETNVAVANTAGRFEQARRSGGNHWRFLPSDAESPREDHQQYYGRIYPMGDGPMPPLDFGCQCGWEPVFDEELEGEQVEASPPSVPSEQEFQFSPASFFQPKLIRLSAYPADMHAALRRMAERDENFVIRD